MDVTEVEREASQLRRVIEENSATLIRMKGWHVQIGEDLVGALHLLRLRKQINYQTEYTTLCHAFDAVAGPELERIDQELEKPRARAKQLDGEIIDIESEIEEAAKASRRAAKVANNEDRRAFLIAAINTTQVLINEYKSLHHRCDIAGTRANDSGDPDDRAAFDALSMLIKDGYTASKDAIPLLRLLESELSSLPPREDFPEFDAPQDAILRQRLSDAKNQLRNTRYALATLSNARTNIIRIGQDIVGIEPLIHQLKALFDEVRAGNAQLSVEATNALLTRGVSRLIHFTRAGNLISILRDGIKTRAKLEQDNKIFFASDSMRLDGLPNTVSLSIQFPNYKMFFQKRLQHDDYVIIEISLNVLSEVDAMFAPHNAARLGAFCNGKPARDRFGLVGVKEAFGEHDPKVLAQRLERELPMNFPFNPQAEVLVCGPIEPKYIMRILVPSEKEREGVSQVLRKLGLRYDVAVDWEAFKPRRDWQYWSRTSDIHHG